MEEKNLIICDTDVLIEYWNSDSSRYQESKRIIEDKIQLDNVIISAITKMELLMGASDKDEMKMISLKLQRFHTALINDNITQQAMELFEKYRLSHGMAIPDCFIAATAIVTQLKLFTYNVKDFRFIENLDLFNNI